jgi:hypothetical protein
LYKKHNTTLAAATSASAYTEAKPAEFKSESPDYYLERGVDLELMKGANTLADLFQVQSGEVKQLIKSNHLNVKREEDLIRIFELLSDYTSPPAL